MKDWSTWGFYETEENELQFQMILLDILGIMYASVQRGFEHNLVLFDARIHEIDRRLNNAQTDVHSHRHGGILFDNTNTIIKEDLFALTERLIGSFIDDQRFDRHLQET